MRWTKARAKAALLAIREERGSRWFMPLAFMALIIAIAPAARQHVRKAIKGRSAVAQDAYATTIRCFGSCRHSIFWPIECQLSSSHPEVGVSSGTV